MSIMPMMTCSGTYGGIPGAVFGYGTLLNPPEKPAGVRGRRKNGTDYAYR